MIDLQQLKQRVALLATETDETTVTRRCLEQIMAELAAGRAAQAQLQRLGTTFSGVSL